jgi:hypothetical protein
MRGWPRACQPEVQAEVAAAGASGALDHRHAGSRMRLGAEGFLDAGVGSGRPLGIGTELPQVVTRAEGWAHRLQHQRPDAVVRSERGSQRIEQPRRQGIAPLRPVEGEDADAPGQGRDAELSVAAHRSRTTSTSPSFTDWAGWQRISFTVPPPAPRPASPSSSTRG